MNGQRQVVVDAPSGLKQQYQATGRVLLRLLCRRGADLGSLAHEVFNVVDAGLAFTRALQTSSPTALTSYPRIREEELDALGTTLIDRHDHRRTRCRRSGSRQPSRRSGRASSPRGLGVTPPSAIKQSCRARVACDVDVHVLQTEHQLEGVLFAIFSPPHPEGNAKSGQHAVQQRVE